MATIHSDDESQTVLDILPDNLIQERSKRGLDKKLTKGNRHVIQKRELIVPFVIDDLKLRRNFTIKPRAKRAVNGQPIELNVELLLVTDTSVLDKFQKLAATTDDQKVFALMRHYYSHLINGVNQRYQESLANDPDMKINIVLTSLLIITVS